MPYISQNSRKPLDLIIDQFPEMTIPELDYVITRLAIRQAGSGEVKFVTLNEIWGAMTGAAAEFYRRLLSKYEDEAADRNGDVYADILDLYLK